MQSKQLNKAYEPAAIEQQLYDRWERGGWFKPSGEGDPYCIMIPPPNVTGSLHMGHAFQDTIMDILIRFHRMSGRNTLWQAGMDHAGIATQMVVERRLEQHNQSRHDLGRERFVSRVWEWKKESGGTINRQLRRMGASLDWKRERFTMDEGLSHAVQEVFIQLYKEGLIYRGKRLVNWDPKLHTAVSDLEVIAEEESGQLWNLRYPILGQSDKYLIVATTRPETMLGDTAVAVHPQDPRYQSLIGEKVLLPLVNRKIPIIADDYVDPEFGSGCVKITPAHDFNDYEIGQRHELPLINIFTPDAAVNLPGSAYHGLDRYEARQRVVDDLQQQGLLHSVEDHKLTVPRGDRTGEVVEPYLTDQWFVRAAPLAQESIKVVEEGRIKFIPENWALTYFEWMRNIQDWCISRQLWWGHRIPAWYDVDGNIFVARNAEEAQILAREKHGKDVELARDPDVLDTWFSSALWPFSTLGWPEKTRDLKTFYPTNVLVTGFDIIFFWVARMIMMGLKFMGDIPFHEVYVHGLVRDAHGQKMSKSKGNVLDPLDLIDGIDLESLVSKRTAGLMQPQMAHRIEATTRADYPEGIPPFGTDALRYTFTSLASMGRNINFDLGRIGGYRNFCNKLWNAVRFILINTAGKDCGQKEGEIELTLADRWIVSRLQQVKQQVQQSIESYRFDHMAQSLYQFVWNDYCSWYLELAKVVLNNGDSSPAQLRGTRRTLVRVMEASLRLLHPIMPFITEALWLELAPLAGKKGQTIMTQPYPKADSNKIDTQALIEMAWTQAVITSVRNIRGEMNIDPNKRVTVFLQDTSEQDTDYLKSNLDYLTRFGKFESISVARDGNVPDSPATALVGNMKVLVPLGDLIDKTAELSRLQREQNKTQREVERIRTKLDNPNFVQKAPTEVVEKERTRAAELATTLDKLKTQIEKVKSLT